MKKNLYKYLAGNEYPGRGIVLGQSPDGNKVFVAYWIMGRSANSRNRVFEPIEGGIRTVAADPAKLEDPHLIIYNAVLTLRELLGTWSENAACFAAGETVVGIVRSVEDYGVFIEIAPNLAGLAEADSTLRPGQAVSVYIKNILPDKMKIKLVVVNKNLGQPLRFEPHYFVTRGRLKRWTYSTPQSRKQIETVF